MAAGTENTSEHASPEERAQVFSSAILGRVETLTLILGAVGTAWAAWRWGWRGGAGLAVGAALSWINFRWLKGSVRSFGQVAATASPTKAPEAGGVPGAAPVRVGKAAYFKFIGRYVLLLGGVYVILTRTSLPAVSVLAGLFTAAAAVVVGIFYQLVVSAVRQTIGAGS